MTVKSFGDLLKEMRSVTPLRRCLSQVNISLAGFPSREHSRESATKAFRAATSVAPLSAPSILAGSSS